jgi:hypothetical protein
MARDVRGSAGARATGNGGGAGGARACQHGSCGGGRGYGLPAAGQGAGQSGGAGHGLRPSWVRVPGDTGAPPGVSR